MSLEEFKTSFVNRCKEAGLDEAGIDRCIDEALAKSAASPTEPWGLITNPLKAVGSAMGTVAGTAAKWGPTAYLGIPAAVGAGGGLLANALQQSDEDSVDDVRKRESIDTYRRLAQEMELRARARRQTPSRPRSPIVR